MNIGFLSIETKSGEAWEEFGPEYLTPVVEIVVPTGSSLADGDYVLGTVGSVSGSLTYGITIEGLVESAAYLSEKDGNLVLTIGEEKELGITDGTDYLIVNAVTGAYLGGGLLWGTQATTLAKPQFIGFEATSTAGAYMLDSHQYNNAVDHYLGAGLYFDNGPSNGTPVAWTFEVQDDGTYTIFNSEAGGYLTGVGFQKEVVTETMPTDESYWTLVTKDDVIASMDNATSTNPVDVTALIAAPELKRNSNTEWYPTWTVTGYDDEEEPSNYAFGGDGAVANCAESYHSTNGFNINQEITLPLAGYYTLSAKGFYRDDSSTTKYLPVLYAGSQTSTFPELDTSANSMSDAYAEFLGGLHQIDAITIQATEAEKTVTIGFKGEDTSLWNIFGELELLYYGSEPPEDPIHECLAEASHWSIDPTTESFHLNTWSAEGDPSGMKQPFMEYWYGAGNNLDDAVISHTTITGEPGTIYTVSIDYRAFNENSDKKVSQGSTFNANTTSADLCLGTRSVYDEVSQEEYAIGYSFLCQADETTGAIDIHFSIVDADFDWLAFKDLTVMRFDGENWPALTAATGDMHTGYADAQASALAAYEANPSFETYLAAFNAVNAAQLSALFYSDIAEALAELNLDEAGMAAFSASEKGAAYEAKTLEYCDMTSTYISAEASQAAGTELKYAVDNAEWICEQGNGPTYMDPGYETYTADAYTAGKVMYQLIENLPEGYTYEIQFYAFARSQNGGGNSVSGTTTAQAYANDEKQEMTVELEGSGSIQSEGYLHTFTVTVGADGLLEYGIENIATGGNWYMADLKSITIVESTFSSVVWTLTSADWGTLILPFDATLPDGLTAYSCAKLDGTSLVLVEAEDAIQANVPYIINGSVTEDTDYSFSGYAVEATSLTAGLLTGTLVDLSQANGDFSTDGSQYVLQNHEDEGLAFYPITTESEGVTLTAYHCYLDLTLSTTSARPVSLKFPDTTTGIVAVEGDVIANDAIYDLSGRRVAKAVKGVYIMNGQKVLVK